jgi:hypothetical protein
MKPLLLITSLLLLSSCASRSISNSGPSNDPTYVGEIHDLNLLGTMNSNQPRVNP